MAGNLRPQKVLEAISMRNDLGLRVNWKLFMVSSGQFDGNYWNSMKSSHLSCDFCSCCDWLAGKSFLFCTHFMPPIAQRPTIWFWFFVVRSQSDFCCPWALKRRLGISSRSLKFNDVGKLPIDLHLLVIVVSLFNRRGQLSLLFFATLQIQISMSWPKIRK